MTSHSMQEPSKVNDKEANDFHERLKAVENRIRNIKEKQAPVVPKYDLNG